MNTMFALLTVGLTSLASPTTSPLVGATTRPDSSRTVLVQNNRKVPVTVYLEYGTFDRRLGVVPPARSTSLPLPAWAGEGGMSVKLFVHPEGEDDLQTRSFSIRPHERISLLVPETGQLPPTPADTMMQVLPPEELSDATITVENPRAQPVTVFAEHGAFDARLGEVPAHGRVTLVFPRVLVRPDQSIEIFVHPEGGYDLASQILQLHRGEHLGLRVPLR